MDLNRTIITQSPKETQELGENVALSVKRGEHPRLICLYGELGSGKTTFVQGFAKGLGLTQARLLSPTFIIVRRYELSAIQKFFYHIDLYRLHDEEISDSLGLTEIFMDPQNYVAVEWPERLAGNLPDGRLDIRFQALESGKHEVKL